MSPVRARVTPLACLVVLAIVAPALAPERPTEQFADRTYAPPMRVHVRDASGWRAPFAYPQVLEDRVMRRYGEDRTRPMPISWFTNGRAASIPADGGPLLLLGADSLGRDILSRLLVGMGRSLGVALAGALGGLVLGALVGGWAGSRGGRVDHALMLVADFILVLPGAYVVLVLRGTLPLTLSPAAVFALLAGLFAVSSWPHVARGVRAIVATERARDYAEAARASGAGSARLMWHLLPAAGGFLLVEVVLLVPALLVAEATVSFLGLGFPEATPSWGTMLQEAHNVTMMAEAPWMLAPALAILLVVFALQATSGARAQNLVAAISSRS
ncbi:MAG TPA: ABC transporter permease [Vicinamibacterales bacterium]|nr:ABC transporter permease [Vicinamibacterales bacterium]